MVRKRLPPSSAQPRLRRGIKAIIARAVVGLQAPTEKDLTKIGVSVHPSHVRRDFRNAIRGTPGLNPADWTLRELRHSFVSLLSDNGTPIDEIARLVGHSSTAVTELVYRQQIRPVLQSGAVVMDRIFGDEPDA
jgi:integrase